MGMRLLSLSLLHNPPAPNTVPPEAPRNPPLALTRTHHNGKTVTYVPVQTVTHLSPGHRHANEAARDGRRLNRLAYDQREVAPMEAINQPSAPSPSAYPFKNARARPPSPSCRGCARIRRVDGHETRNPSSRSPPRRAFVVTALPCRAYCARSAPHPTTNLLDQSRLPVQPPRQAWIRRQCRFEWMPPLAAGSIKVFTVNWCIDLVAVVSASSEGCCRPLAPPVRQRFAGKVLLVAQVCSPTKTTSAIRPALREHICVASAQKRTAMAAFRPGHQRRYPFRASVSLRHRARRRPFAAWTLGVDAVLGRSVFLRSLLMRFGRPSIRSENE